MKNATRNLRAIVALALSSVLLAANALFVWTCGEKTYAAESESEYEKLYYISDYTGSQKYAENELPAYLSEVGLGAGDIEYTYIVLSDFIEVLKNMYHSGYFFEIKNSYVIFEMRQEYPKTYDDNNGDLFVYTLNDIFSTLKKQNCKIMIIFGTDEQALAMDSSYTEFLTCADIVINTNIMDTFMYNYIKWVNDIYGITAFEANVMLSPSLCDDFGQINSKLWLFSRYLIPYYREYIQALENDSDEQVFNDYFVSDDQYIGWAEYSDPDAWNDFINNLVHPVGFGMTDNAMYFQWEDIIYKLRISTGIDFPIFVINEIGTNVADWIKNGTKYDNIFYSGDIAAILDKYVPSIMHDFIVGGDLTQYNNWPGACDITFKPILGGDDGWMEFPPVILAWQVIIKEEGEYSSFLPMSQRHLTK